MSGWKAKCLDVPADERHELGGEGIKGMMGIGTVLWRGINAFQLLPRILLIVAAWHRASTWCLSDTAGRGRPLSLSSSFKSVLYWMEKVKEKLGWNRSRKIPHGVGLKQSCCCILLPCYRHQLMPCSQLQLKTKLALDDTFGWFSLPVPKRGLKGSWRGTFYERI